MRVCILIARTARASISVCMSAFARNWVDTLLTSKALVTAAGGICGCFGFYCLTFWDAAFKCQRYVMR